MKTKEEIAKEEEHKQTDLIRTMKILKQYGLDKSGISATSIAEMSHQKFMRMQKRHSRYCDYPCFTEDDVVKMFAITHLTGEEWQKAWDDFKASFGNVSWDHFICEWEK